jgi:hypothetical protein
VPPAFFLLNQVLIKYGWLATKSQVGIEELPAFKLPVQVSIPFHDSCIQIVFPPSSVASIGEVVDRAP